MDLKEFMDGYRDSYHCDEQVIEYTIPSLGYNVSDLDWEWEIEKKFFEEIGIDDYDYDR